MGDIFTPNPTECGIRFAMVRMNMYIMSRMKEEGKYQLLLDTFPDPYKELRGNTTDELLDLLSNYLSLKKDIEDIMNVDAESKGFYNKEFLVNYDLNLLKIRNELVVRSKNN